LQTIFETCIPREEVIEGEVKADIFAAKLGDVVTNKAPDVYQNPDLFFDNTYPTDGLKTLLSEAFGRLSGVKPANSPVIRLETSFGGGTLKVQDASEAQKDQQAKLIEILRNLQKGLTSDDDPISADYAWDKVWQKGQDSITTEDFRKIFCRKRSLPIVLDQDQIKKTILDGIENGVWVYYDGTRAYHAEIARPIIQLSDDHTLYTLDKAKELGLLEPTETDEEKTETDDDFFDNFTDEFDKGTKLRETPPLISEGTPNKAFETLKDKCADASIKSLSHISFETEGATDSKSIGLALPQLAKFKPSVNQDFYGEVDGDKLELKFSGSWNTFRVVKSLTEQMATKAQRAKVEINLTTKVEISFESPQAPDSSELTQIKDTLQKLNVGKIRLEGKEQES